MAITVEKMSILSVVLMFVFYVIMHLFIGAIKKRTNVKLLTDKDNLVLKRDLKISTFLFKWFPAFYVVALLIIFYVN